MKRAGKKHNTEGQAMLEFVFAFPIVLLMIMGIIEFAYLSMVNQVVNYAAFTAARSASVGKEYHLSAALACLSISPTAVSKINPAKVPGIQDLDKLFTYFTGVDDIAEKLPFAYAFTSVDITYYDKDGKKQDKQKGADHLTARVTYYYPLKFSAISPLANYVALANKWAWWQPEYKVEAEIEDKLNLFYSLSSMEKYPEQWAEAYGFTKMSGVTFIPVIKTCTIGVDNDLAGGSDDGSGSGGGSDPDGGEDFSVPAVGMVYLPGLPGPGSLSNDFTTGVSGGDIPALPGGLGGAGIP